MARETVIKPLVSKVKEKPQIKPRLGQGRAGLRHKKPQTSQLIAQSVKQPLEIPEVPKTQKEVITIPSFTTPVQSIGNSNTTMIDRRMMQHVSKDTPFYPDPVYRPPPKPVKHCIQMLFPNFRKYGH